MAIHNLYVFDRTFISTDGPDFGVPDGSQYTLGTSTITIASGVSGQLVTVDDPDDGFFDDDDPNPQTLVGDYTVNGTFYPSGTIIEAEYLMEVQDKDGTSYYVAAVSFTGDPFSINGFTFHGPRPPLNEALTVVNVWEGNLGALPYNTSSPACFEARTRIATPTGWKAAGDLQAGDPISLADGGTGTLAMVLRRRWHLEPQRGDGPVRLRANALGPGQPARKLVVSPQHRIWLETLGALVPARALVKLPRIGLLNGITHIDYVHLVLPRHSLIKAENCICESFWPGKIALRNLKLHQRADVLAAMGSAPKACAPFLSRREAEAALTSEKNLSPAPATLTSTRCPQMPYVLSER